MSLPLAPSRKPGYKVCSFKSQLGPLRAGHGIENALPQIRAKLIDFFKLPFVLPEGFE